MKATEQLQSHVVDELAWDPGVDSSNIAVTATDGVITLKGSVRSYNERRAAEKAARRVEGVRAIADDLTVILSPKYVRDDSAIASAAAAALKWNVTIPEGRVKAVVSDGWVALDGEVEWQFQRAAAYRAVRSLYGVRGVTNNIRLTPTVKPADIQQKIEDAFKRSAEIDSEHVKVEASGGKVTLRGMVHYWAERQRAENAAWSAPGVTSVENLLKIEQFSYV